MHYRSVVLDPDRLLRRLAPDGWLGHRTRAGFLPTAPLERDGAEVGRFFAARGLDGARLAAPRDLVSLDIAAIAHGASFLLSGDARRAVAELLPREIASALDGDVPRLDHLGIEVYGRLEWYIEALAAWARPYRFRLTAHRIFPSVQVRRVLGYDPRLAGVRIARLQLETTGRSVHLELFEVAQHWLHTVARQLCLFAGAPPADVVQCLGEQGEPVAGPLLPIGHIALAVRRWQTVHAVHRLLAVRGGREAMLYDDTPSYNPRDGSLNTKFVPQRAAPTGELRTGPMIELIRYGPRPSLDRHAGGVQSGYA